MNDKVFVQDILEHPEDDGRRLVFADWLEEQGEADRAAFIRTQVQLARLPAGDPRRAELEARQVSLANQHGVRWKKDLPAWVHRDQCDFRRGLVGMVRTTAAVFLKGAAHLYRTAPVEEVHLRNAALYLQRLAALPELARVRNLVLARQKITDEPLTALTGSPNLANLTRLNLSANRIGLSGAAALAASPYLTHLVELDLSHNQFRDTGTASLAASQHLHNLTTLKLGRNRIGSRGAEALAGSTRLPRLAALDLEDNLVGDRGAAALAAASLDNLTALNLRGNRVGGEGALALAQSAGLARLESLNLGKNAMDLGANPIGPAGAAALAASPHAGRLTWLNLGGSEVGDEGLIALLGSRSFESLEMLNVSWNGVTSRGVDALLACPRFAQEGYVSVFANPHRPEEWARVRNATGGRPVLYIGASRFTEDDRKRLRDTFGKRLWGSGGPP
jgi:uncharacterized protein (TIGR02996 family)